MIFLLLAYYLAQSDFGQAFPIPSIEIRDPSPCGTPVNTRTIWNIIWSCLSTIFLCTWVAVHPNITYAPETDDMSRFEKWVWNPLRVFLTYKLPLFLWALLVPEYILAWAIRQYRMTSKIMDREPRWTRTHAFFLLMGGFHVYKRPDRELKPLNSEEDGVQPNYQSHDDETFVHILEPHNLLEDNLEYTLPTEKEIEDKGKSDGITKAIVLLQTSWFVVQCIARGIRHLPLTKLEVVTLAYTMVNFFIYLFWWYKPRNVGCPLRVYKTSTAEPTPAGYSIWANGFTGIVERVFVYLFGMQDEYAALSGESQVPMFWSGGARAGIAGLALGLIGAVFGSIHFVAWPYGFPSETELILWRMTCIFITAFPLVTSLIILSVSGAPKMVQVFLFLSVSLYIIARILSLIVAFTTLRSLPADAFRVVDWTTFIPHI